MSDETRIDARGLLCPMPVIRLQDRAKSMIHGGELTLLATDPGVLNRRRPRPHRERNHPFFWVCRSSTSARAQP